MVTEALDVITPKLFSAVSRTPDVPMIGLVAELVTIWLPLVHGSQIQVPGLANDETQTDKQAKVARLLLAALPEFARAGLDGARVDAIAAAAGMNKRLLYHYVGDKAALFEAVLDLAYDRVLAAPDGLHGDEWRLICHGCAVGRIDRLGELQSLTNQQGDPARAMALGLRLLSGLLPELADQLLGNVGGDDAGRQQALARGLSTLRGRQAKPRLKLRPDLRSGDGR